MADEAIPLERVKDLQEKVDALVRTLVGSGMEKGLDTLLCSDGFDVETGTHKTPELSRRAILDKYYDTVSKLEEVARKSSELFSAYNQHVVIPRELTAAPSEIPDSTVSVLIPEIVERNAKLQKIDHTSNGTQSAAPSILEEERNAAAVMDVMRKFSDTSEVMVKEALRSVKGNGLRKQPERMSEPGWVDLEAEKVLLGSVLTDANQGKIVVECAGAGLKAADFQEMEHERLWEWLENKRTLGLIKEDTAHILPLLKKEAQTPELTFLLNEKKGEGKKSLYNRLEAIGKKNVKVDYLSLARSIMIKGRLSRMYGAVSRGQGLKIDHLLNTQPAKVAGAPGGPTVHNVPRAAPQPSHAAGRGVVPQQVAPMQHSVRMMPGIPTQPAGTGGR